MEIRVIKKPSRAVTITNLNAAFAAESRRSLRLNRRFNYQNILLFKTTFTIIEK